MAPTEIRFFGITPYLHYDDAVAMIAWFERVFGFRETGRHVNEAGRVTNAELKVGDTEIWIDGDPDWWAGKGRRPDQWLGVWVNDVAAIHARIIAAGVAVDPPDDKPYGVRVLAVKDPEGYVWGFLQRIPTSPSA